MDRRRFMKTTGSIALTGALAQLPFTARAQDEVTKKRIAVFWEDDFPKSEIINITRAMLDEALAEFSITYLTSEELRSQLSVKRFDLLVLPFGSHFPKTAFEAMLRFFGEGGHWINLGGTPLSIPSLRVGNAWRSETKQVAYHKKLGITQSFLVDKTRWQKLSSLTDVLDDGSVDSMEVADVHELYARFASSKDFPEEDGASGPREAMLQPLVHAITNDRLAVAAPIVMIDRLFGAYAGGRWLLANYSGTITASIVRSLAQSALEGAMELVVSPSYACYFEHESPTLTVMIKRPHRRDGWKAARCTVEIVNSAGSQIFKHTTDVRGKDDIATAVISVGEKKRIQFKPGLHTVRATTRLELSAKEYVDLKTVSGFWYRDESLLAGGSALTIDGAVLRRDGKPFPIAGTTYMTSDVHRKFLFEPNPHRWNEDFARMKESGVNMIRTGIWNSWRKYMLDPGAFDETALRAIEAFILTARAHDIPVIFTFFAFLPESWGGANPYLDPQSISAQKQFISRITQRFASTNDIIWDLINEPSFCSPKHLWKCRPNYDEFEQNAWNEWLKHRTKIHGDAERKDALQQRYRMSSDESVSLPRDSDFDEVNIHYDRRPMRAMDYRLFAQDMFRLWCIEMTKAVRSNGNVRQLITVGQDEGGTYERPSPQFYFSEVDLTSNHTWWFNDDLVWDAVMTTSPEKPNLIEETGVMFYEKLDGMPWRSEEEVAALLDRKLALTIACGAAGFIQWLWNTNPFMGSNNEAAIGLFRVDGTAKPEYGVFRAHAEFMQKISLHVADVEHDDITMVIPHSQLYSTRNLATQATRRCVRAIYYDCGMQMNAVSEYRLEALKRTPRLFILPSAQIINQNAWESLLAHVAKGAALLVTGVLDRDEYMLPVHRSKLFNVEGETSAVAQSETLFIGGKEFHCEFRGDKMQRVEKAILSGTPQAKLLSVQHGAGKIFWSPIPIEAADNDDATLRLYNHVLADLKLARRFTFEQASDGVLITVKAFQDALLYAFVSEQARDERVVVIDSATGVRLEANVPAQRARLFLIDREQKKVIAEK